MDVVADYAPNGRRLREVLMGLMGEGMLKRSSFFQKGLEEGEKLGRDEGLAPLLRQFARTLLTTRLATLGADRIGDVALNLEGAQLAAWLGDADAR